MMKDPASVIRNANLRVTGPRMAILKALSVECEPLDAGAIYKKLKNNRVNLVTIYRTLSILDRVGLIRRVDLRRDSVFYEIGGGHHHHLTCRTCNRIEQLKTCEIDGYSKKIISNSREFDRILDHSLEFFGLCKACAKG